MDTKIDHVKMLYAVGVILGVVAAFYFGFRLLRDLSPTTTSATLFLGFVAFLFAGLYAEHESIDTVFYALSAGSYLVFVAYVLATYDLGDGGVFVLLAGSSALFVALGYASSNGVLDVEKRKAAGGVVLVLVIVLALLAFDATGAQPVYTEDFRDTVEVPDDIREQVVVGETTVENPFVLSRRADLPPVNGCLYTPERRHVSVRRPEAPYDLLLGSGETRTFNVTAGGDAFFDRETEELRDAFENRETVPVEVADDCPETADEPKLVISTDGETSERPVPP
jgi:hypothetical protein